MIFFSIDDLLIVEGGLEIGRREASSTFFWLFYLGWIFQPCVREGNFNLKKKVPYGRIHNCVIGLTNLDSPRKKKTLKNSEVLS